MKLLTAFAATVLTLSIANTAIASDISKIPDSYIVSAPLNAKKTGRLTAEKVAAFNEKVETHNAIARVKTLVQEVKSSMVVIAIKTCLASGHDGESVYQCPKYLEAKREYDAASKDRGEHLDSSLLDLKNFLEATDN
ncbi:hypothetical protein [Chamaesiphon sp. OTE_20_metabat_361]|uniref:hypothetical protein n=1 Tax=Chamaesiphon sp. OTE_20_metabat_361 TaxID=2964689 RepID=UPI00286B2C41|nr:hypothetical protein [Chamaesiphon sp. OTE_20_metabat_361]